MATALEICHRLANPLAANLVEAVAHLCSKIIYKLFTIAPALTITLTVVTYSYQPSSLLLTLFSSWEVIWLCGRTNRFKSIRRNDSPTISMRTSTLAKVTLVSPFSTFMTVLRDKLAFEARSSIPSLYRCALREWRSLALQY